MPQGTGQKIKIKMAVRMIVIKKKKDPKIYFKKTQVPSYSHAKVTQNLFLFFPTKNTFNWAEVDKIVRGWCAVYWHSYRAKVSLPYLKKMKWLDHFH